MLAVSWLIRTETPADLAAVEHLQEEAFGPGRFARTAFRVREGIAPDPELCFIGMSGAEIAGSVWLTPITIGGAPAQLLGPLTVAPAFKNRGLGRLLVKHALEASAMRGEAHVLLVGDGPYYGPLGFAPVPFGSITFPGPVDPARVLVACLGGAAMPSGMVRGGR